MNEKKQTNSFSDNNIRETLDKYGVPQESDWRSLFACLFSQQRYQHLTDQQKKDLLKLTTDLLKQKNYSPENLQNALGKQNLVINAPCIKQLHEAVIESEKLLQEFRELSMKRTGDVARLESTAISTIESLTDPKLMIRQLRAAFRTVIDVMKEDTEKLERLTKTDPLTGLGNRRAFDEYLQKKINSGGPHAPLVLLLLDIDHFKKFNDTYGHRIGDQALNTVAKIIKDHMALLEDKYGEDYLTARYGGEEFAILFPCPVLLEAVRQAEAIKDKVESYSFVIRDIKGKILYGDITITVSIGVSELNPAWETNPADHLVEAADEAMYRAKSEGRNLVRY